MSGEASASGKNGSGRKPTLMIAGAMLLAFVVAAGLWFGGVFHRGKDHGSTAAAGTAGEKPVLVDLPDIISNLDTGGHRASFIKLHAKIAVRAADMPVLQAALPQILDIFQTYLRSTRPEELRGGEGTYRLREALMNRIDVTLAPVQASDLLFTQILVQ